MEHSFDRLMVEEVKESKFGSMIQVVTLDGNIIFFIPYGGEWQPTREQALANAEFVVNAANRALEGHRYRADGVTVLDEFDQRYATAEFDFFDDDGSNRAEIAAHIAKALNFYGLIQADAAIAKAKGDDHA